MLVIRVEVLNEEGLGGFEDHPDNILTAAIKKYSDEDEEFRRKLNNKTIREIWDEMRNEDPHVKKLIEVLDEKS